jgi:hypothetical protein
MLFQSESTATTNGTRKFNINIEGTTLREVDNNCSYGWWRTTCRVLTAYPLFDDGACTDDHGDMPLSISTHHAGVASESHVNVEEVKASQIIIIAFHTASRYGHLEMVQYLVQQCQAKCTCCDQGQ